MLPYALIFLSIAIAAAMLVFGGTVGAASGIAQILAVAFLIPFAISLIFRSGKTSRPD
jgi:uncharacterized membrane protein YtjA (UPF0391 family)